MTGDVTYHKSSGNDAVVAALDIFQDIFCSDGAIVRRFQRPRRPVAGWINSPNPRNIVVRLWSRHVCCRAHALMRTIVIHCSCLFSIANFIKLKHMRTLCRRADNHDCGRIPHPVFHRHHGSVDWLCVHGVFDARLCALFVRRDVEEQQECVPRL